MKKAIVVGATSGMGKEVAKILVENDYKVAILGRRIQLLDEIKNQNPNSYIAEAFDIQEIDAIEEKLNRLVQQLGGLDLILISAGIGKESEKLDFEIERDTIMTNALGFTCTVDWAMNLFENQKSGHLVIISSIAGMKGNRFAPSYSATKAFQMNYMEGMRHRAAHLKLPIFVTDIRPGFVDTSMARNGTKFWIVPLEKAGKQIYQAITKKRKVAYISPKWILVAGLIKILPRWIRYKI
jgi:short-subunit dehydrogenase